jgi:hypothetical protein
MARTWLYAGASLAVVGSALFQVYIRSPTLEANGIYRELHPVNHKNCQSIPGELRFVATVRHLFTLCYSHRVKGV